MPNTLDLRGFAPAADKTVIWPDGRTLSVRDIEDLTNAEFIKLIAEEQTMLNLPAAESLAIERAHLLLFVGGITASDVDQLTRRQIAPLVEFVKSAARAVEAAVPLVTTASQST